MQNLNEMWLRGVAAQHSMLHLATYNAAFVSTAGVQSVQMGMNAPLAFWAAIARGTEQTETP